MAILTKAEMANRTAVLATYRFLLRATGIAFKGDNSTLKSARKLARDRFHEARNMPAGSPQAAHAVEHAQGVATILRENVVQGRNVGGKKYKLNIHEHTQRLDNDTAGNLKGTKKSFKEIKNSQF